MPLSMDLDTWIYKSTETIYFPYTSKEEPAGTMDRDKIS